MGTIGHLDASTHISARVLPNDQLRSKLVSVASSSEALSNWRPSTAPPLLERSRFSLRQALSEHLTSPPHKPDYISSRIRVGASELSALRDGRLKAATSALGVTITPRAEQSPAHGSRPATAVQRNLLAVNSSRPASRSPLLTGACCGAV